jgi:N-acetylglutamate synthase-like GNAT family acetyltransferase
MTISIRPAKETDQETITSFIRQARINPRNLNWRHFLVAEDGSKVIGIRQVKVHSQGTREVASGFVLPAHRGKGISALLMDEIFRRETGALYLMCNKKWSKYYEGFGFKPIRPSSLPADLAREYWISKIITSVLSVLALNRIHIIPMKREPAS